MGLDPDNSLAVLEDEEVIQRVLNFEARGEYTYPYIRTMVDKYFGGDVRAFQKRWKEFYENWWPGEFQAMQDCWDRNQRWLEGQKD